MSSANRRKIQASYRGIGLSDAGFVSDYRFSNTGFVSGHRFSDAAGSSKSDAPLGVGHRGGCERYTFLLRAAYFTTADQARSRIKIPKQHVGFTNSL